MSSILREYETLFVLNPELADDAVTELKNRLKAVLEKMNAELLREDNWGKKKFAFRVKKEVRGTFVNFLYAGPPEAVKEFERSLRNIENVIRFLTTVKDEVKDLDAKKAEIDKENREREAKAAAAAAAAEAAEAEAAAAAAAEAVAEAEAVASEVESASA